MARFVVAGSVDCQEFAIVNYIAQYLSEKLPNFHVKKIAKKKSEYLPWIRQVCAEKEWDHLKTPIVWKEPAMRGGDALLIGGCDEFCEYCYEYHGLLHKLNEEEVLRLVQKNIHDLKNEEKAQLLEQQQVRRRIVCLTGAATSIMTKGLLAEIFMVPGLTGRNGMEILLYDSAPGSLAKLERLVRDVAALGTDLGLSAARVVTDLHGGTLDGCTLLIVLDGSHREDFEDQMEWLQCNKDDMLLLADQLNSSNLPKNRSRVIIASPNTVPNCFNATVLADNVPSILPSKIVVVTADLAMEAIVPTSQVTGVPSHLLKVPPVWGFTGISKWVDILSIAYNCSVFEPNSRALKSSKGSTLPQGSIYPENRILSYLTWEKIGEIHSRMDHRRKKAIELLGFNPTFPKMRATLQLLEAWYGRYENQYLPLGIMSTGVFDLPCGLVFSQPVRLVRNRWVPCYGHPYYDPCLDYRALVPTAINLLHMFGVGLNLEATWQKSFSMTQKLSYNSEDNFPTFEMSVGELQSWEYQQNESLEEGPDTETPEQIQGEEDNREEIPSDQAKTQEEGKEEELRKEQQEVEKQKRAEEEDKEFEELKERVLMQKLIEEEEKPKDVEDEKLLEEMEEKLKTQASVTLKLLMENQGKTEEQMTVEQKTEEPKTEERMKVAPETEEQMEAKQLIAEQMKIEQKIAEEKKQKEMENLRVDLRDEPLFYKEPEPEQEPEQEPELEMVPSKENQ